MIRNVMRALQRLHLERAGLILALTCVPPGAAAQKIRIEKNVPYRAEAGPDQVLDLYTPSTAGFPSIVFIHGGSLRSGYDRSSEEYARVCEPFVAAGMGCANMDYRVAPTDQWPAMPEDVAAAIRWMRDNLSARGGDPNRIFLFGHSSGCHLAAALGTNQKYLRGVGLTPGDLSGIILMGCILTPLDPVLRRANELGFGMDSVRARWDARPDDRFASFDDRLDSDPSRFVGDHVPPALIVIATEERFHPPILEQAARFVGLMYDARRPADIVIVPGEHMTSIARIVEDGDPTFQAITRFIADPEAAGTGSRGSW